MIFTKICINLTSEEKRARREELLNEEAENILDVLIKENGLNIEIKEMKEIGPKSLIEINELIKEEEAPIKVKNKNTSFGQKIKNLFSCFKKNKKGKKRENLRPPQPQRIPEVTDNELKDEIIENQEFQVKFDESIKQKKISGQFPIVNTYDISITQTPQGRHEGFQQRIKRLKRPFPGIAVTIDYNNLLKIKNYILPTIIKMFNNIEYDIQYQTSILYIDKLTTSIPLEKVPHLLNHVNLEFNEEQQGLELVLKKVPLVVKLQVKIKKENSVSSWDEGTIIVVGLIDLFKAIIHFKDDQEFLFKPKIYVQLSHWELDKHKFKFRTGMKNVPSRILSKIIGSFKKKILIILKDYIKYTLPTDVTPQINDYLEDAYPEVYFIEDIGINLLWSHLPLIKKDRMTFFLNGNIELLSEYEQNKADEQIKMFSYDELPIPGNMNAYNTESLKMDVYNTEFSLRSRLIDKLLLVFLLNRKEENFEVSGWNVKLLYKDIFVEMVNDEIQLRNVYFSFHKNILINISCDGFIHINILTSNIDLNTGKITLSVKEVFKKIKHNNLGTFSKITNTIFNQIGKFVPSEIEMDPIVLPLGLKFGKILMDTNVKDTNVHLGAILDIDEMMEEGLIEGDIDSGDFGENLNEEDLSFDDIDGNMDGIANLYNGILESKKSDMMIDNCSENENTVAVISNGMDRLNYEMKEDLDLEKNRMGGIVAYNNEFNMQNKKPKFSQYLI